MRRDFFALGFVVLWLAALIGYRHGFVEPRAWVASCDRGGAVACLPRAGLLWAQRNDVIGSLAVGLGLWAFLGAPFAARVAAVALGIAGVVNYNVTWGMLGAALGMWAWLRPAPARGAGGSAAAPAPPVAGPKDSRSAPAG